jgi:methionyl-tRNA formyltransferase
MKTVSILCTDPEHPVNGWLERWRASASRVADVRINRDYRELVGGDFLFLVSCHQIIKKPVRDLFTYTLVLHASALPKGRGMSPHVWEILNGASHLTLSLLNAEDALDSGDIWRQIDIPLDASEIYDEINAKLFDAELQLMTWALENCDSAQAVRQVGEPTFYRKRVPDDSRIDPSTTLAESFDLLRVADPDRYPAFFHFRGRRYRVRIDPIDPSL